jgi:hypothetical protein
MGVSPGFRDSNRDQRDATNGYRVGPQYHKGQKIMMVSAMDISTSALVAQRTRLNAISGNIANISSLVDENGNPIPETIGPMMRIIKRTTFARFLAWLWDPQGDETVNEAIVRYGWGTTEKPKQ